MSDEPWMALAEKLDTAAAAYERIILLSEDRAVSVEGQAIAAALVLTTNGHLFARAASALRARALQTKEES